MLRPGAVAWNFAYPFAPMLLKRGWDSPADRSTSTITRDSMTCMSAKKPDFTNVLVRFDSPLCNALTRTAECAGVSRNALINELLAVAHEQHERPDGEQRAEYNKQRIIAARQRGLLDCIEHEGGVEDMQAASDLMYDLNDGLDGIRARREKSIRG